MVSSMPPRKRAPKRRNRRSRALVKARAPTTGLPLVVARGISLMRSINLYTRISDATWLDTLTYLGMYAMKLYLGEVTESGQKKSVPYGSLQSTLVTIDDLLINSTFDKQSTKNGVVRHRSAFAKAKLKAFTATLSSTAAPSSRSGRIGMQFVWFSEAEALNAANELSAVQKADPPELKKFFQTPGVTVRPTSQRIVKTWNPPRNSWVRDYVNIGITESQSAGSQVKRGLPLGRLVIGFQTLISSDANTSYATEDTSLLLELGGKVDLAEMGERALEGDISRELDPTVARIYRKDGFIDVDRNLLTNDGRFFTFRAIGDKEMQPMETQSTLGGFFSLTK